MQKEKYELYIYEKYYSLQLVIKLKFLFYRDVSYMTRYVKLGH